MDVAENGNTIFDTSQRCQTTLYDIQHTHIHTAHGVH